MLLKMLQQINKFKLITYFKRFILDLDPLLENIPRKDLYNRDTIRREVTDILYLIYLANNTKDSIIKYNSQIEILSRLAILDFYLERAYLYKYINQKQLFSFTTKLETIIKMTHGWIKSSNE